MKLLRVISSMDPKSGGPAQGIRNISAQLAQSGIDETIVCMDEASQKYGIEELLHIVRLGRGKTGFQFNPELKSWLKSNVSRFDIVIVHGLWQYHNYAVYRSIQRRKQKKLPVPKVVIMPHGMLDPYFQTASDRKLKALRNELVWRITEKKAINASDALLFTCQSELELARTTFKGYQPKKELNVGYGIQSPPVFTENFKRTFIAKCPAVEDQDYFLFLSRIDNKKGVSLLIDAYQALQADGVSLPHLVIAGPLNSDYAREMQEKAKTNATIYFPGMLSGDAKWGAFYGASLFVLPSYQENFGIAIVEAMACKVPVLITKQVNIFNEILNGNAGWVLNDNTETSIKKELKSITQLNQSELEGIAINAKSVFEKKFQVQIIASKFKSVLANLIKS